jgi:hypothetical protein
MNKKKLWHKNYYIKNYHKKLPHEKENKTFNFFVLSAFLNDVIFVIFFSII